MSEHPFADGAARVLRAARASVGPRRTADPDRVIAALAEAIRGSARRRRTRTWMTLGIVAFAAAAVVLLVGKGGLRPWGTPHSREVAARPPAPGWEPAARATLGGGPFSFTLIDSSSGPGDHAEGTGLSSSRDGLRGAESTFGHAPGVFVSGGGTRVATIGASFAPGDTLASGGQTLPFSAEDGTEVRLAPKSEVALVRSDSIRWFQLQTGSLYAHVSKLSLGERFVVATPDRQVEVRGTRFRVSLVRADGACGGGTVTRVAVEEGVVTVRAPGGGESRVAAGERWPADCGERSPAPEAASRERAAAEARVFPTRSELRPRYAQYGRSRISTLGAENDLFGQATRAERAGDSSTALRLLDELIARYPASPLREAAESQRLRIAKGNEKGRPSSHNR